MQSNMGHFIVQAQKQKGNSLKSLDIHIFCEVTMNLEKGEFACLWSKYEGVLNKETSKNLLLLKSVVLSHNLKECAIAKLKGESASLDIKVKSVEYDNIHRGDLAIDKFNTEFVNKLKRFGIKSEKELLERDFDMDGWLNSIITPYIYSRILSACNKDNQKNLFVAVFLDMLQNKEFSDIVTDFEQNPNNNNIPNEIFLQSISNVRKEAESKELSTSKTFDFIRTSFELPAPKDVKLIAPVTVEPTVKGNATEGAEPTATEGVEGGVEPTAS
jgi:hypothetical protein